MQTTAPAKRFSRRESIQAPMRFGGVLGQISLTIARESHGFVLEAAPRGDGRRVPTEARIHLMLDFVNAPSEKPLITIPGHSADAGIPEDRIVKRLPVTDADRASLLRLADVMTMETVDEIFSIVIKKHYRCDGGDDFVWSTMMDIARACEDTETRRHIEELRRYFTIERSPYDT